jgi:RimJ/RimL family protein N-acetyltransferase
MQLDMPVLETERLRVRPFTRDDLDAIHAILDVALAGTPADGGWTRQQRADWLEWSVRAYPALAQLYQPPYGDRAVVLRDSGSVIGAAGLVPVLAPLGQLPGWGWHPAGPAARLMVAEVGLYWAIDPRHQRQGYASEAGRALCGFAFNQLRLRRIVALTDHANAASQGVMRRLGMRLERNPLPEPPWLQVVGVLDHPELSGAA